MGVATRVAKNTGYLYARMGITMFISLYTTRLVLKTLGTEDFGIYNLVGGAIAMLGFLSGAVADSTQRFMNYYEGYGDEVLQKKIFNVTLVIHFAISIVAGLLLYIAGLIFFNGVLNISSDRIYAAIVVYVSLIISTMFTIMSAPYVAVMNAHENMKYYAFVGVLEAVFKLVIAFVVVYTFYDKLIIYGVLMAFIPIINMIIMRIYCHCHYKECVLAPLKYWDFNLVKKMSCFTGWKFLASITSMTSNYGMGIVLNHYWGASLNAAQGIANQINSQLLVFTANMHKAVNPVITKTEGSGCRQRVLVMSTSASKGAYFLLSFFAIPFMIEMPYILRIWLGIVPIWAVLFAQLHLVRRLLEQLVSVYGVAITAEGHIRSFTIINSLCWLSPLVITIILFSLGLPPQYMYYSIIAFNGVGLSISYIYFMKRNLGMKYSFIYKNLLLPVFVVTLVQYTLALLPSFFMEEGWKRIILTTVVSTISFVIMIWYVGLNKHEKKMVINIIKRISIFAHSK